MKCDEPLRVHDVKGYRSHIAEPDWVDGIVCPQCGEPEVRLSMSDSCMIPPGHWECSWCEATGVR